MSFLNADRGASNPLKDKENCQSVVVAFEVRRRGLTCTHCLILLKLIVQVILLFLLWITNQSLGRNGAVPAFESVAVAQAVIP